MSDLQEYVVTLARTAKKASARLRTLSTDAKNKALASMAASVDSRRAQIMTANAADLARGKKAGFK